MAEPDPARRVAAPVAARVGAASLLISLGALTVAPVAVPADYSWLANTISEAGAQGLPGAWVTRLGFVAFGAGVIALAASGVLGVPLWRRVPHLLLGLLMGAVTVFSHRPWRPGLPVDRTEDAWHSAAASGIGACLVLALVLDLVVAYAARPARRSPRAVLDLAVLALSCGVPVLMGLLPEADGALQRVMFLGAYAWYLATALDHPRPSRG